MSDSPCEQLKQLQAERIELLAQLAKTRKCIWRLKKAMHDTSIELARLPATIKATDIIEKLLVALEGADVQ